jgi:hypothetical protein
MGGREFVCVCVREREREKEGKWKGERVWQWWGGDEGGRGGDIKRGRERVR